MNFRTCTAPATNSWRRQLPDKYLVLGYGSVPDIMRRFKNHRWSTPRHFWEKLNKQKIMITLTLKPVKTLSKSLHSIKKTWLIYFMKTYLHQWKIAFKNNKKLNRTKRPICTNFMIFYAALLVLCSQVFGWRICQIRESADRLNWTSLFCFDSIETFHALSQLMTTRCAWIVQTWRL